MPQNAKVPPANATTKSGGGGVPRDSGAWTNEKEEPEEAALADDNDNNAVVDKQGDEGQASSGAYGSSNNSYSTPKKYTEYQARSRRRSSKKPDPKKQLDKNCKAPTDPCECNFYDPNRQQIYQSPCQLGVIPMRSAAFQAPKIPLPKLCNHLLPPEGDSGEDSDGVNFAFKPQTHCRTEVTFVIEPKPQPPWLTMLNCGFKPMVNCSAPPCYLSPNGNPGMDFMGGQQTVVNRTFGSQMQYSGMGNFPTLNQIQGQFPGGRIIDSNSYQESSSSEEEDSEEEESSEEDEEKHHGYTARRKSKPRGGTEPTSHLAHGYHQQPPRHSHPTAGTAGAPGRKSQSKPPAGLHGHHQQQQVQNLRKSTQSQKQGRHSKDDSGTTTTSSGHHHHKDANDNHSRSSDWHF